MLLTALLLLPLLWAGGWIEGQRFHVEGKAAAPEGFWLQMQESVLIPEGLCAEVSCSIHYDQSLDLNGSVPAYGYWFRKKKHSKGNANKDDLMATNNPKKAKIKKNDRFRLVGDPLTKNCSLSISNARKEDSGHYYFRLEKGKLKYSYVTFLLAVIVTELTWIPDIHILKPLQSGQLSSLQCSMPVVCGWPTDTNLRKPPTISWTGAALRAPGSLGSKAYTSGKIELTPGPQDHGTNLTCKITFPGAGVSRERTIRLNVSYAPQNLTISVPGAAPESQGNVTYLEAREGQLLRLLCSADGQPPATLSWVREDRVLSQSHPPGPRALALELPAVKAGDSGHYTCRAENGLGSQSSSLELSVQYPPEDLRVAVSHANRTVLEVLGHGASLPVLEGQSLRLACVAHSNPPARLSWAWGAQSLSLGQPSAPGVLELPQVQLQHQGEFTCLARNPLGARNISLILSVHGKPERGSRFLPEAVLATAVVILLCLCLGLIFLLMKTLRKKAARLDAPSTLGPVCRCHLDEPQSHRLHDYPTATEDEEQELHYASLSFVGQGPWNPGHQEDTSRTEYSEIRISK